MINSQRRQKSHRPLGGVTEVTHDDPSACQWIDSKQQVALLTGDKARTDDEGIT